MKVFIITRRQRQISLAEIDRILQTLLIFKTESQTYKQKRKIIDTRPTFFLVFASRTLFCFAVACERYLLVPVFEIDARENGSAVVMINYVIG